MRARLLAGTAALALVFSSFAIPDAMAGPDESKTVRTAAHVDSPKIFWDKAENNFILKSEAYAATVPIEQTVNYLGKGWSRDDEQRYILSVPDYPAMKFLGTAGDLLYQAPKISGVGNTPIWSGFGADVDIPVEKFRDATFNLDLVGFDGPGKMELFVEGFEPDPARRFLSSHDPSVRSTWINPGNHTHNTTTFTKPGRYQVSFRASARNKDTNEFIASTPQTLTWQVGGSDPSTHSLGDVTSAYNSAPQATDSTSFNPTFTTKPYVGSKDGDEHLTELGFTTGDTKDSGTAVFYIDGYFLAEVPVTGGKATTAEMIGSTNSSFQLVYVPSATSKSPRWVSAPITTTTGAKPAQTTTPGQFPSPNSKQPAPAFDNTPFKVSSRDITLKASIDEDGVLTVGATPKDDTLAVRIQGGMYAPGANYPDCTIDFVSTPSMRSGTWDTSLGECADGKHTIKASAQPTSRADVGQANIEIANVKANIEVSATNQFAAPSGTPGTEPNPNPGTPDNPDPSNPGTTAFDTTKVTIDNGHLDIGPFPTSEGPAIAIKDDSRLFAAKAVTRSPEAVTIQVNEHAKVTRSERVFGQDSYDFLGANGSVLYVLPQTQIQGLVWPGFSTEHLSYTEFPQIGIEVTPVAAPANAKWWAFTSDLGGLGELMAASEGAHTIATNSPTHLHLNWAFSAPGEYQVKVAAKGKQADGTSFATAPATLKILVKGQQLDPSPDDNDTPEVPGTDLDGRTPGSGTGNSKPQLGDITDSSGTQKAAEKCYPVRVDADGNIVTKPSQTSRVTGEVVTSGHFDLGAQVKDGKLVPAVKDDRKQPAKWVDPGLLSFQIGSAGKLPAPAALSFLTKPGSDVWMIGATQVANVPWLGLNTMDESIVNQTSGTLTWTLNRVSGPGKVAVFASGTFGGGIGQKLFDNVGGPTSYTVAPNTHMHPNWVFTKAGNYTLSMNVSATVSGKKVTQPVELHFAVGVTGKAPTLSVDDGTRIVGRTASGEPCTLESASLPRTGVADEIFSNTSENGTGRGVSGLTAFIGLAGLCLAVLVAGRSTRRKLSLR